MEGPLENIPEDTQINNFETDELPRLFTPCHCKELDAQIWIKMALRHGTSSFQPNCAFDAWLVHASKARLSRMSLLHGICAIFHVPLAHMPQRELTFDACMPITIDFNPLKNWTSCSVQLKAFKQEDYCVDKRLNQIRTLCPGSAWHFGKTKI